MHGPPQPQFRRSSRRPPDYTDRATKLRLFGYVTALIAVLLLADAARDPDSWRWMWRGETNIAPQSAVASRLHHQPPAAHDPPGTILAAAEPQSTPLELGRQSDPVSRAWHQAWDVLFERLSSDQRSLLFELLFQAAHAQPLSPEKRPSASELVSRLCELWNASQAAALRSALELPHREQEQRLQALRQASGRFADEIRPALESLADGHPLTPAQSAALNDLQAALVTLRLSRIEDDTVFRPAEREVWFYLLARLKDTDPAALRRQSAGRVTYLQLVRQPDEYRGRIVTVSGTAKLAYRVQAPANPLGIQEYFVYWIHPSGGPDSPIAVYALKSPPGFPPLPDRDLDRQTTKLNEEMQVTGFFFKRWAYPGQDGTYTAPLLLAGVPDWNPAPAAAALAARAPLETRELLAMVAAALLLAAAITIVLWRTIRRHGKFSPAGPAPAPKLRDLPLGPTPKEALRALEEEVRRSG